MLLFDTHCHLADASYGDEIFAWIVEQAKENGVRYIANVGYDMSTNIKLVEQCKKYPDFLIAAIGIHPNSGFDMNEQNLAWIEEAIIKERIFAIGEIGLDYYRNHTDFEKQAKFFEKQLILAKKYRLPVLLHIRDAFDDAYRIVRKVGWFSGVLHCFTGDKASAWKFLNLGFYISFSGIITFPKSEHLHSLITEIPLDRILVETDSPYLSPQQFRGSKNFPWNVIYNIKKISILKNMDEEEVKKTIFLNSKSLFFLNGL